MSATFSPDTFAPDGPVARVTSRCLLCSRKSAVLGLFIPGDSRLWGAAAGTDRSIVYGLCRACYDRPDVVEVVEERIFSFVSGGAA